jgi:hypothetical protein
MEWQPIETAPKDGMLIDLWLVDETGRGWREADAYWVECAHDDDEIGGVWTDRKRAGWFAPNHDYDGAPGFCDAPKRLRGKPPKLTWTEATHWMPTPEGPES